MAKRGASQQKSLFEAEGPRTKPSPPAPLPKGEGSHATPSPPAPLPEGEGSVATAPASLAGQSVWVVDAHSLIHQVFHAIPNMTSPSGQPVNAVYGFTRDLFNLLETKQPDFLFCAFDLPGKTFRHELYEQYKAGRAEIHEDLLPQFAFVHRMVDALGIPLLAYEGFEADDIVATVARITDELGGECFVVTGDKDCRQLITDRVKLYNIRKNEIMDRGVLRQEWGVRPDQVVDYQALVGDSTDNVPGVPLIGPKAARELLEKYGTLDNILAHVEEVSGAAKKENLKKYREQALMSRALVKLDTCVPIEIPWRSARTGGGDPVKARALFDEFGFRRLAEQFLAIRGRMPVATEDAEGPSCKPVYTTIDTPEALAALIAEMRQQKQISIDTETTHIWPRWAEIVGISLSWNENQAYYLPLRGPDGSRLLDPQATLDALRPMLEDPAIGKLGQNLKYDRIVLRAAGVELCGEAFDTMVASYLLDAGQRNHNLDYLAKRYLHHTTIKIEELIGSGKHQKRMDEVPIPQITDYAAEDAWVPVRLQPLLARRMEVDESGAAVSRLGDAADRRAGGVGVQRHQDRRRPACRIEPQLRRRKWSDCSRRSTPWRAGSSTSPRRGSFRTCSSSSRSCPCSSGRPRRGRAPTPTCWRSSPSSTRCRPRSSSIAQYAKLKGTYVDALPAMVNPKTGRVHASFNQVVAATGRLSSHDPEPAEHPRADRGRPRYSLGLRARRGGLDARGGRLFADRAAGAGPLHGRRAAVRGLSARRGHPRPGRGAGE